MIRFYKKIKLNIKKNKNLKYDFILGSYSFELGILRRSRVSSCQIRISCYKSPNILLFALTKSSELWVWCVSYSHKRDTRSVSLAQMMSWKCKSIITVFWNHCGLFSRPYLHLCLNIKPLSLLSNDKPILYASQRINFKYKCINPRFTSNGTILISL